LFFLRLPHLRRPPLFPYTTLFRSWAGVPVNPRAAAEPWLDAWLGQLLPDPATVICDVNYHDAAGDHIQQISLADLNVGPLDVLRSEEHTSELQSLAYLVCRLLLEK